MAAHGIVKKSVFYSQISIFLKKSNLLWYKQISESKLLIFYSNKTLKGGSKIENLGFQFVSSVLPLYEFQEVQKHPQIIAVLIAING